MSGYTSSPRNAVLISSSMDLAVARSSLAEQLEAGIQARGVMLDTFQWENETEGGFHCEAMVWYSDMLFLANFLVQRSGMIEMLENEIVLKNKDAHVDLPVKFELPESAGED